MGPPYFFQFSFFRIFLIHIPKMISIWLPDSTLFPATQADQNKIRKINNSNNHKKFQLKI